MSGAQNSVTSIGSVRKTDIDQSFPIHSVNQSHCGTINTSPGSRIPMYLISGSRLRLTYLSGVIGALLIVFGPPRDPVALRATCQSPVPDKHAAPPPSRGQCFSKQWRRLSLSPPTAGFLRVQSPVL
ncbi:hypothetical protein DPEC_G00124700 [Dallia pectoralis]|uniref:Uncharacterized protein n=1 Tax=Dallia pectoralis TaxID=75939 RepID=A0ACC2GRJ8_DALPE|nr:hypothetical protein DPEC_G00124700 [Dallia pectoralis]